MINKKKQTKNKKYKRKCEKSYMAGCYHGNGKPDGEKKAPKSATFYTENCYNYTPVIIACQTSFT